MTSKGTKSIGRRLQTGDGAHRSGNGKRPPNALHGSEEPVFWDKNNKRWKKFGNTNLAAVHEIILAVYLPCAMSASKKLANNAGKFRTLMGVSLLGFEFLPAKIGGMCHEEERNWLSK